MEQWHLSECWTYPLKSAGGILTTTARVEHRGLSNDRRWMLVEPDGTFMTQRRDPKMSLIQTSLQGDTLVVQAPGMPPCDIPMQPPVELHKSVRVWRSDVEALLVSEKVDEWFSKYIERPCHLVWMPKNVRRDVNEAYKAGEGVVSFADGYPFLLASMSSLQDLNARLEQGISMNRFRPNLVIEGPPAFAEDRWKKVKIGEITFAVVKPCDRCAVITIDQTTGKRGAEPLKTLASFRRHDKRIFFGQNLIPLNEGTIKVGDLVEVLEEHDEAIPPLS